MWGRGHQARFSIQVKLLVIMPIAIPGQKRTIGVKLRSQV